MFSNLSHRRVQVHSAELHRRAELHRMAASTREPKPKPDRTTPRRAAVPSFVAGVYSAVARRALRRA
jgi:hypothetical protein